MDNENKELYEHYLNLKFTKKIEKLNNIIEEQQITIELLEEQSDKILSDLENIKILLSDERVKYIELVNRIEKIEDKSQELVSYPYINEFRIPQLDEFLNR